MGLLKLSGIRKQLMQFSLIIRNNAMNFSVYYVSRFPIKTLVEFYDNVTKKILGLIMRKKSRQSHHIPEVWAAPGRPDKSVSE